jgi:hypothetical protein
LLGGLLSFGARLGDFASTNGLQLPDGRFFTEEYSAGGLDLVANAPPILNISNATVTEGDSGTVAAVFSLALSTATPWDVSVAYQTADGTATIADNDYAGVSGDLTIPAGMTSTTITVPVNGDRTFEADETFVVNLNSVINATVGSGQGTGTILNDDPQPAISINDVSGLEGNSGTTPFVFTVSLSNPSSQTITVDFATAASSATEGNDYQAAGGTLSFDPGDLTKTVTVLVNGDTSVEPDETFQVNLGNAQNATIATGTGTGTILNDDSPTSPTISWPNTADIVYGTALGGMQLDASANVPGTFIYTPAA